MEDDRLVMTGLRKEDEEIETSLRPRHLREYIGQDKVKSSLSIYINAALKRRDALDHILLYGPPGLGKTTLACIVAAEMGQNIRVTSGPAIERPGDLASILTNLNAGDVLFIDEIHRFSKSQQDALLHAVENRTVIMIGATTENPYFEVNSALLSRGRVVELEHLKDEDIATLIERALEAPQGLNGKFSADEDTVKTICTLGSAAVGSAKLSALGKTEREIQAFLQPIALDMHMIGNPWANYNVYLSTIMVPGLLLLFVFLITPYSIGTELKFKRSHEWLKMAGNSMPVALAGKLLPHTLVFLTVFYGFDFYIYYILDFPHPGGVVPILLDGFLSVVASQCFGVFVFGLMPSLRMSMSICSLWAVLSFSVCGATYPVFAMDSMIEAMAQLFPLRHYYMIYKISIFNAYPLADCAINIAALVLFMLLPLFTVRNLRRAMQEYVYIP